jgi:hypothetical protein
MVCRKFMLSYDQTAYLLVFLKLVRSFWTYNTVRMLIFTVSGVLY